MQPPEPLQKPEEHDSFYAPDPMKTFLYRSGKTVFILITRGVTAYDYMCHEIETKDGITVKVTADWFSLKAGQWIHFPRNYATAILDAFASKEAQLVFNDGDLTLLSETIPTPMRWHPALTQLPWHKVPLGAYPLKNHNVYVFADHIAMDGIKIDKSLFEKFYQGNEMRRVGFTLGEIYEGLDKLPRSLSDLIPPSL